MHENHDLLTKREAARYLRVSEPTLDRLRKQGELHAVKVGCQIRFRIREDLQSYLSRRVEARGSAPRL